MIRPLSLSVFVASLLVTGAADAAMTKVGDWQAPSSRVSLDFDGPASEGAKALAEKAGWSLVAPADLGGAARVSIHVKDQPADAVLEAIFADTDVTATRAGTLVRLAPTVKAEPPAAPASAAPAPPPPTEAPAAPAAAPPLPTERGEDVKVTGGHVTIRKGEIVHDVSVLGGRVDVHGTVTGDLSVAGGRADIHDGARVVGDCTVLGGRIALERGARVDGDMGAVGGNIERAEGSIVGGKVVSAGDDDSNIHVKIDGDEVKGSVDAEAPTGKRAHGLLHDVGEAITRVAMLFVFGVVVLALASRRMDALRDAIVRHPARSFALGVVGSLAAALTLLVLCVTIIGIPVAVLGSIVGTVAAYAGIVAALASAGGALIGHKTKNVYAQLAFGCLVFLVVGNLPFVGGLVTAAVALIGIGSLVSTRLAGFVPERPGPRASSEIV